MKTRGYKLGFTLLELLIVLAIIGILATVAVASLKSGTAKARDSKRDSDVETIVTALSLADQTDGKFPCHTFQESSYNGFLQVLVTKKLLTRIVRDPKNIYPGNTYEYKTYKGVDGSCGAYAYLGMTYETPHTTCPLGGYLVTTGTYAGRHCHLFLPKKLPAPCDNFSFLEDESNCPSLEDNVSDY